MRLQRALGNQAYGQLLQAKLTVNRPGDRYEQEADRMADQVVRMSEPGGERGEAAASLVAPRHVQRACAACAEEEEASVQRKPLASQITPLVQRQVSGEEDEEEEKLQMKSASAQGAAVSPAVTSQIEALKGSGRPLPASARAYFEPRFGVDFGEVRLHTGGEAAQAARAIHARAFTTGREVVFGAGQYAPETKPGKRLLAHELTHVVQQNAAGGPPAARIQRRSLIFGAGEVRFNECSNTDLSDFAVIREEGTTTVTPTSGVWLETDGFWWRHHRPKTEWFKIGDDCEVDITCTKTGFERREGCTFTTPHWEGGPHGSTNPF